MRLQHWLLGALLIGGCSNVETSMTILGAADSEADDKCAYQGDSDKFLLNIRFDAANSDQFALALRVRNDLQGATVNIGNNDFPDSFTVPSVITPLRMDFRFECDTNGFSDELGPMYVPQFSVDQPFCLQKDTREFQGFDVVPAQGSSIEPSGGKGIALVKPITTQLARAFGETFSLAVLADDCCDEFRNTGGCNEENLRNFTPGTPGACTDLQREFDRIAPDKLSVNKLDDVQKFRPYAIYDWVKYPPRVPGAGAMYPMRLRGVLEGVTGDGAIVSSTEYFEVINMCSNCGFSTRCTNI